MMLITSGNIGGLILIKMEEEKETDLEEQFKRALEDLKNKRYKIIKR